MKNYYKILGVQYGANHNEIKKAYRELALKYHPDKNTSKKAESKFIEATEAYEILTNSSKRKEYDKFFQKAFQDRINFQNSATVYNDKQRNWSKYGKGKARQYSKMRYGGFVKRVFQETKLGLSYIPNFFAIIVVAVFLFSIFKTMIQAFHDSYTTGCLWGAYSFLRKLFGI